MKLFNTTYTPINFTMVFVVLALGASASMVLAAGSPDRADLSYDSITGVVTLDQAEAAGGIITNFVLKNAVGGDDFNTGAVNFPFIGTLMTNLPTEISQTDPMFAGFTGGDQWILGAVFPTGMDLPGLQGFLTTNTYVGELGSGVQDLDLIVTPEPATMTLLGIGGLGLLRRRRFGLSSLKNVEKNKRTH